MIKKILVFLLFSVLVLLALSYRTDISLSEIKDKYCDEESKFIDVLGTSMHYKIEGAGDTIVLIHGTASSLHTWDAVTENLKDSFTIVRFDLPAFGVTGPSQNHVYDIDNFLQHVDGLLTALNMHSFHIAGNSLGGRISWNYALQYPDKVKSLILLDASGYPSGEIPFIFKLARLPVLSSLLKKCTPSVFIRKNIEEVYQKDELISNELIQRYYELSRRDGNRQAFIDRASAILQDRSQKIKNINHNTLIIWGENDLWIPVENAHKFDKDIPNSTLQIIENSGHVPMEEDPDITSKYIEDFVLSQ